MPWVLGAILLALAFIVFLTYPFRVRVQYEWSTDTPPKLEAAVGIFGWWKLPLPRSRLGRRHAPATPPSSSALSSTLTAVTSSIDYLRSIRRFERLEWKTHVGTGSAASTALAVGALWSVQGIFLATVSPRFAANQLPDVTVVPHWDDACFDTRFDCIFRMRLGEIILAWIRNKLEAWRREVKTIGFGKGTSN